MYLLENISISTAVFCDMFSTMLSFSVENGNLGPHFPIYDFNFYCLVQWNILLPLSKTAENVFTLLELNLLFTKVAENDFTLVINKNHRKCYKKNQGKSTPLANQMTFIFMKKMLCTKIHQGVIWMRRKSVENMKVKKTAHNWNLHFSAWKWPLIILHHTADREQWQYFRNLIA